MGDEITALIGLGLLLGFAGLAAWAALRSLREAVLQVLRLLRPVRLEEAAFHVGEVVALWGRVHVDGFVRRDGIDDALWLAWDTEEYEDVGYRAGWRTVDRRERIGAFGLAQGEDVIRVGDVPTTVTSFVQRDATSEGQGRYGREVARERRRWLPACRHLTVVGRLDAGEHGLTVLRDARAGLLLSPLPPGLALCAYLLRYWLALAFGALVFGVTLAIVR